MSSRINDALEAVIGLVNSLSLYSTMTHGALGTGQTLTCELSPYAPREVYLDKNQYISINITINGKHKNLETLSTDLNTIHESLTMAKSYPYGEHWSISDITNGVMPQVIGREADNSWVMASSLNVMVYTDGLERSTNNAET